MVLTKFVDISNQVFFFESLGLSDDDWNVANSAKRGRSVKLDTKQHWMQKVPDNSLYGKTRINQFFV